MSCLSVSLCLNLQPDELIAWEHPTQRHWALHGSMGRMNCLSCLDMSAFEHMTPPLCFLLSSRHTFQLSFPINVFSLSSFGGKLNLFRSNTTPFFWIIGSG